MIGAGGGIFVPGLPGLQAADLRVGPRAAELNVPPLAGGQFHGPGHGERRVALLRPGDLHADHDADVPGVVHLDVAGRRVGRPVVSEVVVAGTVEAALRVSDRRRGSDRGGRGGRGCGRVAGGLAAAAAERGSHHADDDGCDGDDAEAQQAAVAHAVALMLRRLGNRRWRIAHRESFRVITTNALMREIPFPAATVNLPVSGATLGYWA